ncbi:MAG: hypothetical protein M3Q06_04975 [Bacteroidota bacterium]|nr:hypothetical protein [Bacteroidota bacterium]
MRSFLAPLLIFVTNLLFAQSSHLLLLFRSDETVAVEVNTTATDAIAVQQGHKLGLAGGVPDVRRYWEGMRAGAYTITGGKLSKGRQAAFSSSSFRLRLSEQSTRGCILLKNIAWGSLSGLLIGTAFGLKQEEPTLRNISFLTVVGAGVGFATGTISGIMKAAKRKDDIFF